MVSLHSQAQAEIKQERTQKQLTSSLCVVHTGLG